MKLENAVVLITGANRGLGLAFAKAALARGARKVYAAARDPATVTLPGVIPVKLDVTSDTDVAALAAEFKDVTVLVNNAGIAQMTGFLDDNGVESARQQMETNYYGPLRLTRAFAGTLAANGGGAILNVLSVVSWINSPMMAGYSASKSAAWSLTNGLRHALRAQGTQVLGLHMGFVDTDLTQGIDAPKTAPEVIVARAYDALEAGADEVLGDEITEQVKAGLSATPGVYTTDLRARAE
ncbi:NAD(P)-dependent dehydrogenase (short-subunit alcohol dehydrogenase family) [Silvimonas terrae]|uniref:NAD(P)-dependent dehydrogenase (Short-subunit alcohol dehydrogenase family) n=1 Tax=Silvimonas terrae TaxID=300266 RepID=A0A840RJY3_9NEIS|nr:SDR family oxidoreductase [Silvimonas terrae]MBB5192828.1 NAD(P)-dependent dehydrogenase (short-subunit alcohol dehydrogenase family) [Silvimonas terrae]